MPTQIEQDILKEMGIADLPPERQEEVLTVMTEAVLKRIILRLMNELSEEKRAQLEEIGDSADPEKISQFLTDNIPNHETLIKEEIVGFKKDTQAAVDGLLA